VLKGEIALRLREDRKLKTEKKKRRDSAAALAPADQSLFDALRKRRKEIADQLDLPPYVIFHDATLKQLAELRPTTEAAMLSVNGIGAVKLERYGKAFLEVITAG
jgi:ATP-dependent DNA helicase RecQ